MTNPPAEPAAPFDLSLLMQLPPEFAEFGLAEHVVLPADIFRLDWGSHGEMIQQAVLQQCSRAAYSLATSLNAVLVQRAAEGAPLTHEAYLAHQQALLVERERQAQEAREAAAAAVLAEQTPPDAPQGEGE